MAEEPRIYAAPTGRMGRAPMSQIELLASQVSPEELEKRWREQQQRELLDLDGRGFTICLREDFDWDTYAPFVVRIGDQSVWKREIGSPPNGYLPDTHCVVVPAGDTAGWFYLTSASVSSPGGPRSVAELEERKAQREQHLAEQAKEEAKAFQAKKKTARPVLLADLERDAPENLRAALEQLDRLGGRVRIAAGRVVVELPPSELGQWAFGAKRGATLATILYRCEPAILEAMSGKDGVLDAAKAPDRPLLPSGQMAP